MSALYVAPEIEPGDDKAISRETFLHDLDEIARNAETPLVLALHGSWGTGKTHLLNTWRKRLDAESRPCVYFNAWEHDHGDDPFVSFVGEVKEAAATKLKDELVQPLVEKAVRAVPGIIKLVARLGVNVGCSLLGLDKDLLSSEAVYAALGEQIQQYSQQKRNVEEFRTELSTLADEFGKHWQQAHPGEAKPPLLILVDELDRCRPDYAIALLERVKHVLSVRGVLFLFAVDMVQLRHTAKSLYGIGMDADGYFRRFFDAVITLPCLDEKEMHQLAKHNVQSIYGNQEKGQTPSPRLLGVISALLGLSLRENIQVTTFIQLFLKVNPKYEYADIVMIVYVLRSKNIAAYQTLIQKKKDLGIANSIIPHSCAIQLLSRVERELSTIGYYLVGVLLASGYREEDIVRIKENSSENKIAQAVLEYVCSRAGLDGIAREVGIIETIMRKVELFCPPLSSDGGA